MPSCVYIAEKRDTPRILLWVQMMKIHFPQVAQLPLSIAHCITKSPWMSAGASQRNSKHFPGYLERCLLSGKPQAQ